MRGRSILGALLLAGAVTSRAAYGESPRETVAEALFRQAREEMRQGAFAEAYAKLTESLRIGPSNGALLNLMICEEHVGKVASAWLHGRELLEHLDSSDDRRAIVERHVAALNARVPMLTVRLATAVPGDARVLLDGLELGPSSLDTAFPIDPGRHSVVVAVPGREDRVVSIDVAEAGVYQELAEASEPPQPRATMAALIPGPPRSAIGTAAPSSGSSSRDVAWPALATGIAGLVASGVLGLLTLDREQAVRSACPGKRCQDPSGLNAADQGRLFSAGAVVALSAGVAGTGLGLYLLTRQPAAAARAPARSPSGAMVGWTNSF